MEDKTKYKFKCVVESCKETGDRGFFRFPDAKKKAEDLGKWLTALGLDAVPTASQRVCFRHFSYPGDFYMCPTRNRPVKYGKLKLFFEKQQKK